MLVIWYHILLVCPPSKKDFSLKKSSSKIDNLSRSFFGWSILFYLFCFPASWKLCKIDFPQNRSLKAPDHSCLVERKCRNCEMWSACCSIHALVASHLTTPQPSPISPNCCIYLLLNAVLPCSAQSCRQRCSTIDLRPIGSQRLDNTGPIRRQRPELGD